MSNLARRSHFTDEDIEGIERDIATAYTALLEQPSGSLIAATLTHAPENVIVRLQARDAHYLDSTQYRLMCRGSFEGRSEILGQSPRDTSTAVPKVLVLFLGSAFAAPFCLTYWDTFAAWPLVAVAGLVGLAATFGSRWVRRDPLRLTRAQRSALMTPVSEGGWSVSATDSTAPEPTSSSMVGLIALARAVIADIRSSPAWLDPTMNDNWIRLDLDRELTEITSAVRTLSQMRDRVVEPTPDNVSDPSEGAVRQWRQAYETLYASIIGRLVALKHYRDDLASVGALIANQVAVRQIQGTSQQINDSLTHVALCDAAVTGLEARLFELADVKANLTAQKNFLDTSSG